MKKSSPRSPCSIAVDSTTDAVDHPCGGGEGKRDPPETRVGVDCATKGTQLQLNFCDDGAEKFGDTLGPPAEAGSTRAFRHCDLAALQPSIPRKHCTLATVPCKIVLSSPPPFAADWEKHCLASLEDLPTMSCATMYWQ